ncbi:hypothetical protein ACS0TY_029963 [Phlomoides rotata]
MGLAMILHDEVGDFVAGRSVVVSGLLHPDEWKVLGLTEALSWIKKIGLERVEIEMDAKLVVDAVNSSVGIDSIF